jgi:hypothetical protein
MILALLGGTLMVASGLAKLKSTKVVTVILGFFGIASLFGTASAFEGSIELIGSFPDSRIDVRIEQPKTPIGQEFNVGFVALNTTNDEMVVRCYVKRPSEASFWEFDTFNNVKSGGDSDDCSVDSSVLTEEGTYEFYVTAQIVESEEDPEESDAVSVVYDNTAPERPKYIEKDKKNSCKYEIEFKTHDEGDTSYVKVYRDDEKDDLDVNSGTEIRTFYIGPDEKLDFTDELSGSECSKTPYYAIVAFDDAGNASDVRAEKVVEKVTVYIEGETESEEQGAIEVYGADLFGDGSATGTGGPEGQGGSESGEEESILGEQDTTVVDTEDTEDESNGRPLTSKVWFWFLILAVLFGAIGVAKKRKE